MIRQAVFAFFLVCGVCAKAIEVPSCPEKLTNTFMEGEPNGKLVAYYLNENPAFIYMTAKKAVAVYERADGSRYYVLEEYMDKAGTTLVYFPVTPISKSQVPEGIIDPRIIIGTAAAIVCLGIQDVPIHERELFVLAPHGEDLEIRYFQSGRTGVRILKRQILP